MRIEYTNERERTVSDRTPVRNRKITPNYAASADRSMDTEHFSLMTMP